MLLKEFFGRSIDVKVPEKREENNSDKDELFWFFIDHDRLHKDFVLPIAQKIKKSLKTGDKDNKELVNNFMPMVEKGCLEYYHKKKLTGKPEIVFPKEMREEMCQRLYDHYCDGIQKNEYRI